MSISIKGIYALDFGRHGHQCPKNMTEGICIPFTIVWEYIYPFSLEKNTKYSIMSFEKIRKDCNFFVLKNEKK